MGGYKPKAKYYVLTFPQYEGLEITTKGLQIGQLIEISNLKLDLTQVEEKDKLKVFSVFANKVITWNIEHPEPDEIVERDKHDADGACARCGMVEGQLLPTTVEAMMCLDLDFIMPIIMGWVSQQATVSPGKGQNSNAGDRITEDAMRRLDALQNQSTLPQPNFS